MTKKNMSLLKENKRGQLTIFIIVAILIVVSIVIFFFYVKPTFIAPNGNQLKIQTCLEDAVKTSVDDLASKGGTNNPKFSYQYMGEKIPYLCYTNLYYRPCVVQTPFLKQSFEAELTVIAKQKLDLCYDSAIEDLKARGYDIYQTGRNFTISLEPGRIIATLNAPVTISRESSQRYSEFKTQINSPIYDMLMIATSIIQYETRLGNADTDSLRTYYPNLMIQKMRQGDETKVYIIQDKQSKTKYQFATRSYAWPPGYGVDSNLAY